MAEKTNIEWTDVTWNPIAGCSIVSPGCTNCYAMRRVAPRLSGNPATPHYHGTVQNSKAGPVWTGKIGIASDDVLTKPLRRKKPTMYFVNSTSDLFHENVPDEVIDRIFAVMALCPQHTFQVLTKRSARMRAYMDKACGRIADTVMALRREHGIERGNACAPLPHVPPGRVWWPLPNIWLGVSVEDQTRADERIPDLLATPAAVRFISAEPLLGPLDLWGAKYPAPGGGFAGAISTWQKDRRLDWVIVGGESGNGARPMHPDWARQIRDQCAAAGVPFFFKQWGEWRPSFYAGTISEAGGSGEPTIAWPDGTIAHGKAEDHGGNGTPLADVGKSAAGRLLDGIEHNAMPEVK